MDGPYPTFLACLPCAQRLKSSTPPLPKLSHPLELAEYRGQPDTQRGSYDCVQPVGGQWDTCASFIVLLRWLQKSQGTWYRVSKERATRMHLCSSLPLALSTASRLHLLSVPSSVTSTISHSHGHTQSPLTHSFAHTAARSHRRSSVHLSSVPGTPSVCSMPCQEQDHEGTWTSLLALTDCC